MVWFTQYRPISCHLLSASMLKWVRMPAQWLDVRHRPTLKQHPGRKAEIATAMEQQFRPSIRHPIDIVEVLRLCESERAKP